MVRYRDVFTSRGFVVFLFAFLAMASVGVFAAPEGAMAARQVFRFAVDASDAGSFDPHAPALNQDMPVWDAVFDTLVTYVEPGKITTEVKPHIAEDWTVSEDGLT